MHAKKFPSINSFVSKNIGYDPETGQMYWHPDILEIPGWVRIYDELIGETHGLTPTSHMEHYWVCAALARALKLGTLLYGYMLHTTIPVDYYDPILAQLEVERVQLNRPPESNDSPSGDDDISVDPESVSDEEATEDKNPANGEPEREHVVLTPKAATQAQRKEPAP